MVASFPELDCPMNKTKKGDSCASLANKSSRIRVITNNLRPGAAPGESTLAKILSGIHHSHGCSPAAAHNNFLGKVTSRVRNRKGTGAQVGVSILIKSGTRRCGSAARVVNGGSGKSTNSVEMDLHSQIAGTGSHKLDIDGQISDSRKASTHKGNAGAQQMGGPPPSTGTLFNGEIPSDNSSNNFRWSSTSCASSDTRSSSSTRRSSWESRPSLPSMAASSYSLKPHKAHDTAWVAIRSFQLHQRGAPLSIEHFKLIRRVGHGDIGSVFLAHLKDPLKPNTSSSTFKNQKGQQYLSAKATSWEFEQCGLSDTTSHIFAIKVMDRDSLAQRDKLQRMNMEKQILECVDHPFLPTLYAHFDCEQYSCLVMDFCPGGDLYALRQKQVNKRFGIIAARFYAAEVLLALEYLHMLGIVYRDLKPENVLVREDGHIMLTDFDLSLKCDVQPQLLKHPSVSSSSIPVSKSSSLAKRRLMRSSSQSSTISSSSTTSFLRKESLDCVLVGACTRHPSISCLSLTHKGSERPQHIQRHPPRCDNDVKGSKASKVGKCNGKDGTFPEPFKATQQDMHPCTPLSERLKASSNQEKHLYVPLGLRGNSNSIGTHSDLTSTAQANRNNSVKRVAEPGQGYQEENMMLLELVVEPTQARSMSFVGTHEYLAPEIIAGHGHGSPVDWWTFGIFLYELLFAGTPFKGGNNDETLINIIRKHLQFPEWAEVGVEFEDARSLIQGLLVKDPRERLGCSKGAGEIKQHAFFRGVNWALIRCAQPPELPCSNCSNIKHGSSLYHHHPHLHHPHLHHFDFF